MASPTGRKNCVLFTLYILRAAELAATVPSSFSPRRESDDMRDNHPSSSTALSSSQVASKLWKEPTFVSQEGLSRTKTNLDLEELDSDFTSPPLPPYQQISEPHPSFFIPVPPRNTSTLTLGYLVEHQARKYSIPRDWKQVSGALSYAVHTINKEGVLPGYNLTYVIRDTHMQTNDSLMAMSILWRDGVVGFIASASSCPNEAMLAGAWNLPILSHVSISLVCWHVVTNVHCG